MNCTNFCPKGLNPAKAIGSIKKMLATVKSYLFNIIMKLLNTLLEVSHSAAIKEQVVFNPATGEQSSEVKLASSKDVSQAVDNAKKAFETFGKHTSISKS